MLVGVEELWNRKQRTDCPQARWLWYPAAPVARSLADEDDEAKEIGRALAIA